MRYLKEVTVEVTQKCYSSCLFCSSLSSPLCDNEIPLEMLKEISRFSLSNKLDSINISGGEPLLRSDIEDLIAYNESIGLKSCVYTSGNIKDTKKFGAIIDKTLSKRSVKFIFNYPSCQKDIFQYLIKNTRFEPSQIDSHIAYLLSEGIEVEAHIVPNAINVGHLFETITHLKSLGIKKVSLLRLVLQGRAKTNEKVLTSGDFYSRLELGLTKILGTLPDKDFEIRLGTPFSDPTAVPCECLAGVSKLLFRYDGVVFPCEAFKESPVNEKYILGNIYHDSLDSIWSNPVVHKTLRHLRCELIGSKEACPAQVLYQKTK